MAERNRRRRLWLGIGLGLALGLGVAWQVGKRLLDVDRYRSVAAAELERWTGLPVAIGRLDLALRPIPALSAFEVSLGRGEFRAVAGRIDLFPVLSALWERRLEIARVDLGRLDLTLPADPGRLERHWDALVQHVAAASQPAPTATASPWDSLLGGFALHRVLADDVAVRLDPSGEPWIRARMEVSDLAEADVQVDLDAHVPAFGTRITGRLRLPSEAAAGSGLEGDFTVGAEWPDEVLGIPGALRSSLEATARLRSQSERELRLTLDGRVEPQASRAFSGTVSGELRLADGALGAELAVDGPALALRGSARSGEGGATELRIDSLDTRRAGLMALFEWLGPEFVELSAAEDATLEVREVALAFDPDGGAPELVSGSLSARGLEAGLAGRPLAQGIVLEVEDTESGVAIRTLRGGPFDLTGDLLFAPDWSQFEVVMRGDVALTPDLLERAGASAVESVSGRIRLEELRQAFPAAQAQRDELPALRARVTNASLRVAGDGWADDLSGIGLRVTTEGATLLVEGRARSHALGDLNASAAWRTGATEARGRLAVDPAAGEGFGPEGLWEALAPLLRAWGSDGVEVHASWPETPAGAPLSLRLERTGSPTLHAQLELYPARSGDVLGDVTAEGQLPAPLFEALLPAGVEAAGDAEVRLERDAARATFSVDADLGALALRSGRFVEKRAGEVLRVQIVGDAPARELRVKRLVVASAKAALPLEWREGRLLASDFDIDLADWAFLLAQGTSASGRLRGAFATNPLETRVELSGVGLRLSPDLGIDTADGSVALDEAGWSVRELRMRGAGSDVLVDAAREDGQIQGRIRGASLDVDFVRALVGEVRALLPEPAHAAVPMRGTLAVNLDRVRVGRSEASGIATEIRFDGEDVHVPAFDFETYEGRVTGALDLVAVPGGPRRLDLKLEVADVTGRFLDDFFFEAAPRGIRGVFRGTLEFAAPLADDVKAMLAAGDGRLAWTARDGSFGKLGFATKITTALRATQALRARLPPLKDEGLVFDTVKADFPLQQGQLRIEVFELDTTSYAISAEGILDFAQDRSDVPIVVDATTGLTGILDKVPIAGDALQIVNVRLQATGSPYDLTVRMASFKDLVVGASLAGPKSMVKRVRDAMALAKRANGDTSGPEPGAAPEAAQPGGDAAAAPGPEEPPAAPPETETLPDTTDPLPGGGRGEANAEEAPAPGDADRESSPP